jgi:hypothetical protein
LRIFKDTVVDPQEMFSDTVCFGDRWAVLHNETDDNNNKKLPGHDWGELRLCGLQSLGAAFVLKDGLKRALG